MEQKSNGFAITALVLGIVAIILCLIPFVNILAFLLGILSLIFGILGLLKAKSLNSGKTFSVVSIVLGSLSILGALMSTILYFAIIYEGVETQLERDNTYLYSNEEDEDSSDSYYDEEEDEQATYDEKTRTLSTTELDLKIDKWAKTTDVDGEPVLKIYFTITNKKDEEESVYSLLYAHCIVKQRNDTTSNELHSAFLDSEEEDDHLFDNLNPQATISGFYAVELEDETHPVILEFRNANYTKIATLEIHLDSDIN